ncbi:hypothetical protein N7457_001545 [Penicillium paradoxum]|uniref:uncharacterized protein n=1 Tax=Penicillium paradoxum TaxID=176176 RepID=UPI0025494D00|nr:uncharacterized protein N7457_001545 [Penicillium paradoxum]KAJ5794946.1 hypothetical protein N7457_001545 [Penicillium paradoxum]
MCQQEIAANGWTSTPANAGTIFGDQPFINEPEFLDLNDIQFPFDDPTVAKTLKYAKGTLHHETFNHSMRVYFYGMSITKQQFPKQAATLNPVTWALTCLLHDLGTAEENLTATRMSFDIYGGIKALSVLKDFGASTDQAEAVAEAIIRHQDMGVDGTLTFIGQLIQLATTYDNTGIHPHVKDFGKMIHETTRAQINEAYPRLKWSTFFAGVIRKEEKIKPWCHSTHLVNFDNEIEGNTLMKQWE